MNNDNRKSKSDKLTSANVEPMIDPSQMKIFSRMWFCMKLSAKKSFSVCTAAGERLAWCFGITKPKYHAEMQRYEHMNKEEREAWQQAFQDVEDVDHIRDSINK